MAKNGSVLIDSDEKIIDRFFQTASGLAEKVEMSGSAVTVRQGANTVGVSVGDHFVRISRGVGGGEPKVEGTYAKTHTSLNSAEHALTRMLS